MPFLVDYLQWRINTQLASGFCEQKGLNPLQDISIHYRESVKMNPNSANQRQLLLKSAGTSNQSG